MKFEKIKYKKSEKKSREKARQKNPKCKKSSKKCLLGLVRFLICGLALEFVT